MTSAGPLSAPPVLSTPESHIFEDPTPVIETSSLPQLSDDEVFLRYEIERTVKEIRDGKWKRIALQFPDDMVGDGVRVYRFLKRELVQARKQELVRHVPVSSNHTHRDENIELDVTKLDLSEPKPAHTEEESNEQLHILADTSYGSCCVDEIAAEHVDAQVVVHYGRSCLSPPARLPVIYVFTTRNLDADLAVQAFRDTYSDMAQKVILMADLPYHSHLDNLAQRLGDEGYGNILVPEVSHNPASVLPNRVLPATFSEDVGSLSAYALFHVGPPPPALLLTLTSRVASIHVYAGDSESKARAAIATPTLRRRYALLTSLSTASIFGVLVNTLSVKNYLHVVSHVQKLISDAGKKSYTFVVGKVNPAKVANFAEIGGWVVIGCWESSLVESRDFYKPLITPFELELALMSDKTRQWNGDWRSDFDAILSKEIEDSQGAGEDGESNDEDESLPPEFDLRSGRYISHSRPMQATKGKAPGTEEEAPIKTSQSLIKRANGELANIGGVVSPGAEYLNSAKSWKGLGSDYEIGYEEFGAVVGEGHDGIAKSYVPRNK